MNPDSGHEPTPEPEPSRGDSAPESTSGRQPEGQPEGGQGDNRRDLFRVRTPLVGPDANRRVADTQSDLDQPILVRLGAPEDGLTGILMDLTELGLAVLLRRPLPKLPKEPLTVRFCLPLHEEPLELWALAKNGGLVRGGFRLGLEFQVDDPQWSARAGADLRRFLIQRQQRDLRHRAG